MKRLFEGDQSSVIDLTDLFPELITDSSSNRLRFIDNEYCDSQIDTQSIHKTFHTMTDNKSASQGASSFCNSNRFGLIIQMIIAPREHSSVSESL